MAKGKIKKECHFDDKSGEFECEAVRLHEDGQEVIGFISGGLTADCKMNPKDFWEVEEGVLRGLNDEYLSGMRARCQVSTKSLPQDY